MAQNETEPDYIIEEYYAPENVKRHHGYYDKDEAYYDYWNWYKDRNFAGSVALCHKGTVIESFSRGFFNLAGIFYFDVIIQAIEFSNEEIKMDLAKLGPGAWFNTDGMSVEELAERIRNSPEWVHEYNEALCRAAGMEERYNAANFDGDGSGESFEHVVEAAAKELGVEIY